MAMYNYDEDYVDPEAGTGWKTSASARRPNPIERSNNMPVGDTPERDGFGSRLSDGNSTAENFDCGYRNPFLSDPNMRKARREELATQQEAGFVTRNNYWERS